MSITFDWTEYVALCIMIGLSVIIGTYYGCYKKNQNTVSEYMQGGKKMRVFPIAMSLVTSHFSGITILGTPEEVYKYGTQHAVEVGSILIVVFLILLFYLPVFFKLQLNSPYEYLERRFNHSVRLATSFIFAVSLILYIPAVIYAPALAFNQVSGLSTHAITVVVCLICILYTTLGGLKAVVWTDTLQSLFSFGAVIFVIILGTISAGGPTNVFKINREGHRLELFNMDPNPFARNTFLSATTGLIFIWISFLAVHPGAVQRFTAVPTYKDAVKVTWWFFVGLTLILAASYYHGLLIYARYHDCDPVASKLIHKNGQIVPLYVSEVAGKFPGLSGLFIAGVISAALSTMSACLNTLAGTIYEDFVMICCSKKHNDARASFIMKILVIILGVICTALVSMVEKLGAIIQMATTLMGITAGSTAFIFTFGMLFPWGTSKGALAGLFTSMAIVGWIAGGAQIAIATGRMSYPGKIISTEGCTSNLTIPLFRNLTEKYEGVGSPVITDGTVPLIYQLSFVYYGTVGVIIGTAVAIVVSLITGTQDLNDLDPDLIAPQLQRFLPRRTKPQNQTTNDNEYKLVSLNTEDDNEEIQS